MKKLYSAAVCAALIGWAGAAGALTIENGSFENGSTGWVTTIPVGSSGSVSIVSSSTASDGTVYTPPAGNSFAELTATASLQQTGLSWNAGEQLTFNWAFLGFEVETDPATDFAFFTADGEGTVTLADIEDVGPVGDTGWQSYVYTFANSGSGSIEFGITNAIDEQFSSKLLIDDVSSVSVPPGPGPAPIPEPGTMLLFGAGLIGLAGFARRRRASKD